MKIAKFLFISVCVTIICLFYVHQRVELIKLSYNIKDNQKNLTHLLDQNRYLMYNVNTLKSPANLEKILVSKNIKLESPAKWEEIKLAKAVVVPAKHNVPSNLFIKTRQALFAFFSFKSVAEAKTIK